MKVIAIANQKRASTANSGKSRKTSPALPTMIPCVGFFIFSPSALRNAGVRGARIGTWFSVSCGSCSPIGPPADSLS